MSLKSQLINRLESLAGINAALKAENRELKNGFDQVDGINQGLEKLVKEQTALIGRLQAEIGHQAEVASHLRDALRAIEVWAKRNTTNFNSMIVEHIHCILAGKDSYFTVQTSEDEELTRLEKELEVEEAAMSVGAVSLGGCV